MESIDPAVVAIVFILIVLGAAIFLGRMGKNDDPGPPEF